MRIAIAGLALLLAATPADAQRLTETRTAVGVAELPPKAPRSGSTGAPVGEPGATARMTLTGGLFAAGGIFAGGYIGAGLACGGASADDWCELGGAIIGAMVGELVMLPLGVHVASGKASYGGKLLASSGIMLAGIMLAPVTGGVSLLLVPPVQLMTTVGMENSAIARGK